MGKLKLKNDGIYLFFGLCRCGKTTLLAKIASETDKAIDQYESPWRHIYGNIPLEGLNHYKQIDFSWLGKYDIRDALVLIDESGLECDNRDYKAFKETTKEFMMLHGHYKCCVCFFNQQWDGLDKKVRVITDRVYYVSKKNILGKWLTTATFIPYGILFPDPKSGSEKLGEIVQGYCKPPLLNRLFSVKIWRPRYYRYFDSYDAPALPPLPESKVNGKGTPFRKGGELPVSPP